MEQEHNNQDDAMRQTEADRRHRQAGIQNDRATVRMPMLMGITLAGGMLIGATFFGGAKSLNSI